MKAVAHDYVLLGKNLKVEEEYAGWADNRQIAAALTCIVEVSRIVR